MADNIARYFGEGTDVEVSSNDEGFQGSWYLGTVIRPPGNTKRTSSKVLVEYKTLMEDVASTKPLTEEINLVDLRPSPPQCNRSSFKFNEEVDAYYNDGWWEGIVTGVLKHDQYLVFFRGSREQMKFKGSKLRLHREWFNGKWVPPLEALPDTSADIAASTTPKRRRSSSEPHFSRGDLVEISSEEEGFEDAWFVAKVLKKVKKDNYLVEYQTLRRNDNKDFLREEVHVHKMRPSPPEIGVVDSFLVKDEVDALYNDGWWLGAITRVLKNGIYSVFFKSTGEQLKFRHSDLRLHQEWKHGQWTVPSRVQNL